MRYGIILSTGDPRTVADLAAEAEAAGWDGAFTYDAIAIGEMEGYDPWVTMAAMAMSTRRIVLGAIITPPSRRRPWKWAREAITLDHLSGGRLVLPVGLGALDDAGFGNVGEATEARVRAERLDEALAILAGLSSGEPFAFDGRHYQFGPMTFRPPPIQRPRIPVWPVGAWPHERSMRRTLRWDGIYVQYSGPEGITAAVIREIAAYAERERPAESGAGPWEIVVEGATQHDDAVAAHRATGPLAEAGATWWIESDWSTSEIAAIRRRIRAGPPSSR